MKAPSGEQPAQSEGIMGRERGQGYLTWEAMPYAKPGEPSRNWAMAPAALAWLAHPPKLMSGTESTRGSAALMSAQTKPMFSIASPLPSPAQALFPLAPEGPNKQLMKDR